MKALFKAAAPHLLFPTINPHLVRNAEMREGISEQQKGTMDSMGPVGEDSAHKTLDSKSRLQQALGKECEFSAPTTFSGLMMDKLGMKELCSSKVWRASVAELVGTAALVFTVDTVAVSSFHAHVASPHVLIAVLTALSLTILLLATYPVSGGHLNPVITLAAALLGLISFARAAVYVLAQCAGAVLGTLLLRSVLSDAAERYFSLGGCTLTGVDSGTAFWLEAACTFVLLLAVRAAFDEQHARALGPITICGLIGGAVGIMSFVSAVVTGREGYAGAGMNPARCVGPAVVRGGGRLWRRHWVFWVGPGVACVAFHVYALIIPREHFDPHGHRGEHEFGGAVKAKCAGGCTEEEQV